jgi:hypothetical protein
MPRSKKSRFGTRVNSSAGGVSSINNADIDLDDAKRRLLEEGRDSVTSRNSSSGLSMK